MAEYRVHEDEHDARAYQLLDHLLDQWLILADTFKRADPALAKLALEALDERLDEFVNEIGLVGWDREWYVTGRQCFRRALIQRLNSTQPGQLRSDGFTPQD